MLLQEQLQQSLLAATASGTPLKISISFELLTIAVITLKS